MTTNHAQPNDPLAWLPALILLTAFSGNWDLYEAALFARFRLDFMDSTPLFPGLRWAMKRHPETDGKPATFWHLISEGHQESERLPDMRRCERISWPRCMIDEYGKQRVHCWRSQRNSHTRVLIAVDDFSYVVVLEERKKYIMLWTAFHVERAHRRAKLQRECNAYHRGATN